MSLIPFLLDLADEISELNRVVDDDFGFGLYPNEFRRPSSKNFSQICFLPKKQHRQHPYANYRNKILAKSHPDEKELLTSADETDLVSVIGKHGFQVNMNVKQFKPNELTVKTIDNCIIIEGKHDEKEDGHGVIARHFVRKYNLPKGYDSKEVFSSLSSDGILTVRAPHPNKSGEGNERMVHIQQTGPAHLSVKENRKDSLFDITIAVGSTGAVGAASDIVAKDVTTPIAIVDSKVENTKTNAASKAPAPALADTKAHTVEEPAAGVDAAISSGTDKCAAGAAAVVNKASNQCENGEKVATEEISN